MRKGAIALGTTALILVAAGCDEEKSPGSMPDDAGVADAAQRDAGHDAGGPTGPVSLGHHVPLGASCGDEVGPAKSGPLPSFQRKTLTETPGAAFLHPADLDADGFPELLLTALTEGFDASEFGNGPPLSGGAAYVLRRDGGAPKGKLGTWSAEKLFGKEEKVYWPNESELVDVDADGVQDWIIGAGFLGKPFGKLVWLRGTSAGFEAELRSLQVPDEACWYHVAVPTDMDGDGDEDFVTTCHVGTSDMPVGPDRLQWFENPGDGSSAFEVHEIGDGGGTLLTLHDVDDDGDVDVITPQYFAGESLVWWEQTKAKGTAWKKHVIDDTTGHGFLTKLADMNGDGRIDLVYDNHNNEEAADESDQTMGVYWFELPPAKDVAALADWSAYKHVIYEGFEVSGTGNAASAGAPGMFNVGDIDGDCDIDVAVSGDGDEGLYLFVQQKDGFETVTLDTDPGNLNSGAQHIFDVDGDGDLDIVVAVFGPIPGAGDTELHSSVSAFVQNAP